MPRSTTSPDHAYPPHPAPPPATRRVLAGTADDQEALVRLSELHDVALAAGVPDIRGWTVRSSEGRAIGTVDGLLVDTARMRVRYMAVALDHDHARADGDRCLLTPVDTARLDRQRREVLLARSVADIAGCPHREHGRDPS